jgi:CheY-like chemotaxis protein
MAQRVLIIEDDGDLADALSDLVSALNHEAAVATSGAVGLTVAQRFRPDVIVCDLGLPGMDGYNVARALRADPATAGARLVALTGDHSAPPRVGTDVFDSWLLKPISGAELEPLLAPSSQRAG